jgi:prevent-host-death family protein
MKLSEDIKPITYMKNHPANLIETVNSHKRPIIITQNGVARAVLLDIDTYEKQRESLMMLKLVAQGEQEIKEGKFREQEAVFEQLDKKFAQ